MVPWSSLIFFFLFLHSLLGLARLATPGITPRPKGVDVRPVSEASTAKFGKDENLEELIRYFEQTDAIHRESWWVLSEERRSPGRSPFGKVQRALQSFQKIKLSNKSLFRCDRYQLKKEILGPKGFPLRIDVFEKCSEKTRAKLIAKVFSEKSKLVEVSFFPENLEEVLGLGPSVINKTIVCNIFGNESGQVNQFNCSDWAQDRSKEQMIRLDTYEYQRTGNKMIKLRGKVYENLTDTRKIVADIPLEGKIEVVETELYPPQDEKPKLKPLPSKPVLQSPGIDPDVLSQQQKIQDSQGGTLGIPLQSDEEESEDSPKEEKGVIHGR